MPNSTDNKREVTFITPGGDMLIRMSRNSSQDLCEAAANLKARYFVTQDGFDDAQMLPIWGVFDLTRCDPNGGGPRVWSMADPIRTFVTETTDPAVMFAVHLGRA